jgi:long-chain fatty acid transport protein
MRISSVCRVLVLAPLACAGLCVVVPRAAHATAVTEFPDNGSEQMARGGAWVARASDPLAAFYNPAGLAGQDTKVTVQANLNLSKTCFTRVKSTADTVNDGVAPGATYPEVCSKSDPFPNPQLAFAYRLSDRVGLGFAVLGPAASGKAKWPDDPTTPQRYMLIDGDALFFTPTLGIGAEVADGFRIGASFQWGIAHLKFSNRSIALNANNLSPAQNDVDAELDVKSMFVPGFTLGTIYSPSDNVDIAGWYKWSAPIVAKGDVTTAYGTGAKTAYGDTSQPNCGDPKLADQNLCGDGDNARFKVAIPMEAKLGVRFHQPREAGQRTSHRRDPLSQDVWDAEVDLTWANNSAVDNLEVRFPGDAKSEGVIPVNGLANGTLPPNADVRHHYKDVIGVRLGGDVNVVRDKLAVRAGAFFETNGQDEVYQNIDFAGGRRIGFALGGTYRIRFNQEKKSALELSLGFGHVFVADQTNDNPNAQGLNGLAGSPCNPTESPTLAGDLCTTGRSKYRANWPVNLGTITNSFNMINVGISYRF